MRRELVQETIGAGRPLIPGRHDALTEDLGSAIDEVLLNIASEARPHAKISGCFRQVEARRVLHCERVGCEAGGGVGPLTAAVTRQRLPCLRAIHDSCRQLGCLA
ncbi:hypothetical protein D3C81_1654200 [compost metagenome]